MLSNFSSAIFGVYRKMVWMFVSQQNDVLQKTSQEGVLSCPKNQTVVWLINYLNACAVSQLYKALASKQLK